MAKVLMVLSSHGRLGDSGDPTGWFLPEAAHPYAVFKREGIGVDFVSPLGGRPPMEGGDAADPLQAAFLNNPGVAEQLRNTLTPSEVQIDDYDAILFIGGHGPSTHLCWPFRRSSLPAWRLCRSWSGQLYFLWSCSPL